MRLDDRPTKSKTEEAQKNVSLFEKTICRLIENTLYQFGSLGRLIYAS